MQKESSGYWDQEVSIDSNASFADSGSFTDKTENGDGTPYELTISGDYKKKPHGVHRPITVILFYPLTIRAEKTTLRIFA